MHPGANDVYGENELLSLIDRIRYWVRGDGPIAREVEAVEGYIDSGIKRFERVLQRHAEFDAWLAERSAT